MAGGSARAGSQPVKVCHGAARRLRWPVATVPSFSFSSRFTFTFTFNDDDDDVDVLDDDHGGRGAWALAGSELAGGLEGGREGGQRGGRISFLLKS